MTTSGTYNYDPALSDVVLTAYARCGKRRTSLTAEHFIDAGNEGNLLLSEWSNLQPLLWKSELIEQVLTQGVPTYVLPKRVVMILTMYIQTGVTPNFTDRVLGPLSTVEYASMTNKLMQAPPNSFWFDRQSTPQVTFWPNPDGGGPYTAKMRCVVQPQDAVIPSGVTIDIPYRAQDAFIAGLAYRLARIHAQELEDKRKMDYKEAWAAFTGNDTENVAMYVKPQMAGYFR